MNGNLVLSRKVGEVVVIELGDEQIEVEVGRIGPSAVRLMVRVPKQFNVRRKELASIAMGACNPGKSTEDIGSGPVNSLLDVMNVLATSPAVTDTIWMPGYGAVHTTVTDILAGIASEHGATDEQIEDAAAGRRVSRHAAGLHQGRNRKS